MYYQFKKPLYLCTVKRWERWQDDGKHPKPQKRFFHLIKGKSGKAVKRQTEKVNTTFFEKSAFVVIGEIDLYIVSMYSV